MSISLKDREAEEESRFMELKIIRSVSLCTMRVLGETQGLDYSRDSGTMAESLNQYSWALSSVRQ